LLPTATGNKKGGGVKESQKGMCGKGPPVVIDSGGPFGGDARNLNPSFGNKKKKSKKKKKKP